MARSCVGGVLSLYTTDRSIAGWFPIPYCPRSGKISESWPHSWAVAKPLDCSQKRTFPPKSIVSQLTSTPADVCPESLFGQPFQPLEWKATDDAGGFPAYSSSNTLLASIDLPMTPASDKECRLAAAVCPRIKGYRLCSPRGSVQAASSESPGIDEPTWPR
jgi:hypothetical protein